MVNILRKAFLVAAMAAFIICGSSGVNAAVIDDFSDLNDTVNPTWTHLDAEVVSSGQAWDASTGEYRFTAPNNGVSGIGFVGSYTGPTFSDVLVMADVVNFLDDPIAQGGAFGITARMNGVNAPVSLTGYAYAYEPFAAGGAGEMVLYRIQQNPSSPLQDIGSQAVTLDPTKDYTLVLEIKGSQLHGQVFEKLSGLMVADKFATDTTWASGFSGLMAYSQAPLPATDVTWDNFKTQVPEPASAILIGLATAAILARRRFQGTC